ncbi:MAG: PrsW family intramembrane metalloprotease [Phycisphaerales bacterium]|nr:PrsW family intramembrane metalloprotease [Phycisphaerales bacterium]
MKRRRDRDPSVFAEPQMPGAGEARPDPSERAADRAPIGAELDSPAEEAARSVFDEPAFDASLAGGVGAGACTYRVWLEDRRAETSRFESGYWTVLIALTGGPLAVVGTFVSTLYGGGSVFALLAVAVIGPSIEEVMKAVALMMVVEKRPYLFRSPSQIVLAGACSGLVFSIIENLLYTFVYIDHPSARIIAWRWTVCTALHTVCTTITSIGLARCWSQGMREGRKPDLERGAAYLIAAVVIHGAYNAIMSGLAMTGMF